jgi:hypothetical protein
MDLKVLAWSAGASRAWVRIKVKLRRRRPLFLVRFRDALRRGVRAGKAPSFGVLQVELLADRVARCPSYAQGLAVEPPEQRGPRERRRSWRPQFVSSPSESARRRSPVPVMLPCSSRRLRGEACNQS